MAQVQTQTTLRDYLQEVEDAITSSRIDDALQKCQHMLSQFPESLDVQRLLGEVYLAQGRMTEAQQAFDWVLTNDPENVIAYCDRALISERLSDIDTALDCYQQAYELSRGNSHIRQQFNQLSVKVGQQGFMFSRAGLARLYMRGDLLPQAISEWETILAVTPDRLDARTGLLETLWREGLYERVEQLALEILRDVPECLKALLLLAYVTAAANMERSQSLVQRAEALDPDLFMAQELFSDLMASYPGHPFLKLLKKPPVVLKQDVLPSLGQIEREAPDGGPSLQTFDQRSPVQEQQGNLAELWQSPTLSDSQYPEGSASAWNYAPLEPLVADDLNQLPGSSLPYGQNWEDERELDRTDGEDSWSPTYKQEDVTMPPAWLSMLTQSETQSEPKEESAPVPTQRAQQLSDEPANSQQQSVVESLSHAEDSWHQASQAALDESSQDEPVRDIIQDEEGFFFGPEWLKSLGATPIDEEVPGASTESTTSTHTIPPTVQSQPLLDEPQSESKPQVAYDAYAWPEQSPETEVSASTPQGYDWLEQLPANSHPAAYAEPSQPDELAEQNVLTTLENLEQDLRSQGFVPLEPNSLSTIARNQEKAATFTPEVLPASFSETAHREPEAEQYQENILSSALAQLGGLVSSSPFSSPNMSTRTTRPLSEPEPTVSYREPLWAAELRSVPASIPNVSEELSVPTTSPVQASTSMSSPLTPAASETVQAEPSPVSPLHAEVSSASVFDALPAQPVAPPPAESARVPASHMDFESELEATMKRPAIRLQPVRQQQMPTAPLPHKGHIEEQQPAANKVSSSTSDYQERLLKGYQHQLMGDYDEAMQEYRIIIRNSPELLADVISKVHALLKLAPNYSVGYRILGDAYMRQGEYLQAMEAYNKALTMTKKVRA